MPICWHDWRSSCRISPLPPQRLYPGRCLRVLLTVEEAAERLHIGKTKTYALVKSCEIESVLIGRLRRIHIDAVTAYAARLIANQQNTHQAAAQES